MSGTFLNGYKLLDKIGIGNSSIVFKVKDFDDQSDLATKITKVTQMDKICKDLYCESKILTKMRNIKGFPKINDCGIKGEIFYVFMEKLGPSLHNFFKYCQNKFSLQTVLLIGFQMVQQFFFSFIIIIRSSVFKLYTKKASSMAI